MQALENTLIAIVANIIAKEHAMRLADAQMRANGISESQLERVGVGPRVAIARDFDRARDDYLTARQHLTVAINDIAVEGGYRVNQRLWLQGVR